MRLGLADRTVFEIGTDEGAARAEHARGDDQCGTALH
jgi:hypothetical protein